MHFLYALVFSTTLLTSATLLFLVQPMFAKMVLPRLGGTPAVWNTCMVFYQAVLLLGYLYAHFSTKWLGARRQALAHLGVLLLPWLCLPIVLAGGLVAPGGSSSPTLWLLGMLAVSVGLPFFVVSASAPMLQAWFAQTDHPAAKDPYFLYAASNLGSMAALLGYPFLELWCPTAQQSRLWMFGYIVLTAAVAACAVLLWRSRSPAGSAAVVVGGTIELPGDPGDAPTLRRRLRWLALSFAPSSLMLGVTTYMATDVASVPLLWIIPLTLYLLTFVIVFAKWPTALARVMQARRVQPAWLAKALDPHWIMVWVQPFLVILLLIVFYSTAHALLVWFILLHLSVFFVSTMVCHGELARSRPSAKYLTEFYIWMSVGGVLGGLFNAIIAPIVFPTIVEYPLVIAVACMLRPRVFRPRWPVVSRWLDLLLPAAVFGVGCLMHAYPDLWYTPWSESVNDWLKARVSEKATLNAATTIVVLGGLTSFAMLGRPVRFGLAVGGMLLAGHLWIGTDKNVIYTTRSFYGVIRVTETTNDNHTYRTLMHGSTSHGTQYLTPAIWRTQPVSYYCEQGPMGRVLQDMVDPVRPGEIGIIGLGTGTTAAYGRLNQRYTYFEIDPDVLYVARDSGLFTYLADSRASEIQFEIADARVTLESGRIPDGFFDVLLVDAFSSDAIPVHLLTKEAIALYMRKLRRDGILLVHISNRHLTLAPVVGNIVRDLGLQARVCEDPNSNAYRDASEVVAVVRDLRRLAPLLNEPPPDFLTDTELADPLEWREIPQDDSIGVWTDDYSNILTVLTRLRKLRGLPE
jgi:preprotein translocase subunit SecG